MARKKGSRNKGYWFRKGRGWYVGSQSLKDLQGNHIKDRGAEQAVKEANRGQTNRQLVARRQDDEPKGKPEGAACTVKDVCLLYLKDAEDVVRNNFSFPGFVRDSMMPQ